MTATKRNLTRLCTVPFNLRQLRPNHSKLRSRQVPASSILGSYICGRVRSRVFPKPRFNALLDASAIPVTAVENLSLEQHNRMQQPVRANVLRKPPELLRRHLRKREAVFVRLVLHHSITGNGSSLRGNSERALDSVFFARQRFHALMQE